MMTQMVPETAIIFNQSTRLIAQEDFINLASMRASDFIYVKKCLGRAVLLARSPALSVPLSRKQ
jgi:hypothetical protein